MNIPDGDSVKSLEMVAGPITDVVCKNHTSDVVCSVSDLDV